MTWRVAVAGVATAMSLTASVAVVEASRADLVVESPGDSLLVIEVLRTVRIERENSSGYDRDLFRHWIDADGDGCDTREEVLKRDAVGLPQVDPFRCTVVEADWLSPYDGKRTSDRGEVDIDHVVALKEAWDSGAWQWPEEQRTAFANDTTDPRTLLAVSSSSNRSKSDRDPSNWLPPLRGYICTYLSNWVSVKARWNLSMDRSEWGRINNLLSDQCSGTTMRGWNPPPRFTARSATSTSTPSSRIESKSNPISGRPGSFCAPEGAVGRYNERTYVCSRTNTQGVPYSGNRARWRRQS